MRSGGERARRHWPGCCVQFSESQGLLLAGGNQCVLIRGRNRVPPCCTQTVQPHPHFMLDTVPQAHRVQPLSVLETSGLKPRCQHLTPVRETPSSPLLASGVATVLGLPRLVACLSSLCLCHHVASSLGVCASVPIPSPYKDTSHRTLVISRAHPDDLISVITSARTLFSDKVTVTGTNG